MVHTGVYPKIWNVCMPENTIHTKIPTNNNDDVAKKWCVGDKYVFNARPHAQVSPL